MGLIIVENDKKLNYFNAYDYCWIFKEIRFLVFIVAIFGSLLTPVLGSDFASATSNT